MRMILPLMLAAAFAVGGCRDPDPAGPEATVPAAMPSVRPSDTDPGPTPPVATLKPGRPSPSIEIPPPQ
ncbi:MAG: hypothetical protein OEV61_08515 [Chloroflexota bacterium]|nr:hypothetical protein [Chloroflexota bacterium]